MTGENAATECLLPKSACICNVIHGIVAYFTVTSGTRRDACKVRLEGQHDMSYIYNPFLVNIIVRLRSRN